VSRSSHRYIGHRTEPNQTPSYIQRKTNKQAPKTLRPTTDEELQTSFCSTAHSSYSIFTDLKQADLHIHQKECDHSNALRNSVCAHLLLNQCFLIILIWTLLIHNNSLVLFSFYNWYTNCIMSSTQESRHISMKSEVSLITLLSKKHLFYIIN